MTATKVNPMPTGYHTVTPYLSVKGSHEFAEFLKKAFDAKINICITDKHGNIGHADALIGDSHIMFSEACDEWGGQHLAMLNLYVENADAWYQKALAAGAKSIREVANQFYGDRSGGVQDPWGNTWWLSTHIEDVSEAEMKKRRNTLEQERDTNPK